MGAAQHLPFEVEAVEWRCADVLRDDGEEEEAVSDAVKWGMSSGGFRPSSFCFFLFFFSLLLLIRYSTFFGGKVSSGITEQGCLGFSFSSSSIMVMAFLFGVVSSMGLSELIQHGMRRVSGLFAFPEHNTSGTPDLGTFCFSFWKRDEAGKASKFDVIVMYMLGFHLLFLYI